MSCLKNILDGIIIITTPHPCSERVLNMMAKIRLVSAVEIADHMHYYDYAAMKELSEKVGLEIYHYKRFLLGFNQLFILRKK